MFQNRAEAGAPITIVRRKIRASVKGFQIGGEPYRHGPAASAGGGLDEHHVDPVHVGTLLTIHLDRYKKLVQNLGNLFRLKRFALHDVAPMTR